MHTRRERFASRRCHVCPEPDRLRRAAHQWRGPRQGHRHRRRRERSAEALLDDARHRRQALIDTRRQRVERPMHHLEVLIQVQKIKALGIERRGSDTRHGPSPIRYIQAWLLRDVRCSPHLRTGRASTYTRQDRCRYPTFYGYPDPRNRSNVTGGCFVVAPVMASDRDLRALAAIVSENRLDLPDGEGLPPSLLADLMSQIRCDVIGFVGFDSGRQETWSGQLMPDGNEDCGFEGEAPVHWQHYWHCQPLQLPRPDRRPAQCREDLGFLLGPAMASHRHVLRYLPAAGVRA